MIYEVTTNSTDYKIYPDNEIAEIAQNILMIVLTPKYSLPLDRNFGLDYAQLDSPINASQAIMTAKITDAVQEFEPRAKVSEVIFNNPDISNPAELDITVRFVV